MKILFVNAGNDSEEAGNANIASFPPLGIISMATMVERHYGQVCELRLVDGQLIDIEGCRKIITEEKPDAVIVSMYCTSINYAISCIKAAHENGAVAILGNDHAKAHYRTLLMEVREIDFISLDEFGEFMVLFLVQRLMNNGDIFSIPNIAYVKDGKIVRNPEITDENVDFMRNPYLYTPAPDRTLLQEENWAVYLENFKKIRGKIYSKSIATGVTTMNAARGCVNNRRRCAYCGIGDLHVYQSPAYRFWEDIMSAKREIKANFFYECCDNFTYSTKYLKEICYCRPNNLDDVHLIVYSSADCVNQMNCDLLKELGVYLVNLGLDAGDAEALSMLKGNNVSVEENYFAVDMLTKKNLEMHISFVLMGMGSNGRTRKSLDKTMEFIRYLVGNTSVTILDCALFYPDRMAPVGGLIWTPENYRLYKESYHLDYIDENYLQTIHDKWKNVLYIDSAEITRDFARLCGTDCELLLEYQQRIKDICEEYNISFGYSQAGRFGR